MIIFGTRGIGSTKAEGNFFCPQCETERAYRHRKVTRFFTLYFIPLIPLGSAGEYVECRTCKGTFIPRVLEQAQNTQDVVMALYEKAMRHSMVMMMLADGEIDPNEKLAVQNIINKFGTNDITLLELDDYVKVIQSSNQDVSTYLKQVGPMLNEHGKEVILKCGLTVAAADGHIDPTELGMVSTMGQALEMSSAHVKGIITEFLEEHKQEAVEA